MLQEKAEIQNMVVVRHWALVDLQRRFQTAEREDEERRSRQVTDMSPPRMNGFAHGQHDPRLQIEGPKSDEDKSRALVKYDETSLKELERSLEKAMHRPNKLLRAPTEDIVEQLLAEWTRVLGSPARTRHRHRRHQARYESASEEDEINFDRIDIGGRHIDGQRRRPKNVHFQRAHVESDSEDLEQPRRHRHGLKNYVLDSDSVSTSTDSDSLPPSRRSSNTSHAASENGERSRRPYSGGSDRSPNASRPNSRNGLPPPPIPMPRQMSATAQPWAGTQGPGTPTSLRPPPYSMPPPPPEQPQRKGSIGPLSPLAYNYPIPVSPSTSPNTQRGLYFNPPRPVNPQVQPYRPASSSGYHPRAISSRRKDRDGRGSGDKLTFKENAKRDVKRGIIGAGAVAGLMDILEGLSGI